MFSYSAAHRSSRKSSAQRQLYRTRQIGPCGSEQARAGMHSHSHSLTRSVLITTIATSRQALIVHIRVVGPQQSNSLVHQLGELLI
eukprot:351491-Chlamydomonas_euryale.AAC.1